MAKINLGNSFVSDEALDSNNMDESKILIIKQNLFDKKAVIRRKAALIIAKEKLLDCSNDLLLA